MTRRIQGVTVSAGQTGSKDAFSPIRVVDCDARLRTSSDSGISSLASAIFYLGVGLYLFFTLSPIGVPSLYYDEVLYLPITLRALYGDQISVYAHVQFADISVMIMPYLGALKAYLMAPIVLLMGSSIGSIRLPGILLGLANIVLLYRFLLPRIGKWETTLVFLLLATDPVYAFHSKLDWGPTSLAHFFTVILLTSGWKYTESHEPRHIATALWACVFGTFDKLNFLWIVSAYVCAFSLLYGRKFWQAFCKNTAAHLVLCLPQISILCVFAVWLVPSAKALGLANPSVVALSLAERLFRIEQIFVATYSGASQFNWVFGVSPITSLSIPCLAAVAVPFGGLVCFFQRYRRCLESREKAIAQLFTFAVVSGGWLIFVMVLTPEVGGSHHLALLWPIPQLLIGLMIGMCFNLTRGRRSLMSAASPFILGVCVLGQIVWRNCCVAAEFRSLAMAGKSFTPYFDPGIEAVAGELCDLRPDQIVTVEWGLSHPLLALLGIQHQKSLIDLSAYFNHQVSSEESHWLSLNVFSRKKLAVVSYQHQNLQMSLNALNFDKISPLFGKVRRDVFVPGRDPRNGFRISVFE